VPQLLSENDCPNILFVTGKWADFDPRKGPSDAHHNLFASLEATGLAKQTHFFIDDYLLQNPPPYDPALIAQCERERPDVLFISLTRGVDHHASPETLAHIREHLGIKVVGLFPDTFDTRSAKHIERYSSVLDLALLQDSYTNVLKAIKDTSKCLPVWTPQDAATFYPSASAPVIDVSFLGSLARYPGRKLALGLLKEAGVSVRVGGGHGESAVPLDEYAAIMRASKIVVNFARPVFDEDGFQCKGRVFEALYSGALLLEQSNPETRRWLTPGVHYVEFETERDLLHLTQHYLTDEPARRRIAEEGHRKAVTAYSATSYWQLVLDRLAQNPNQVCTV